VLNWGEPVYGIWICVSLWKSGGEPKYVATNRKTWKSKYVCWRYKITNNILTTHRMLAYKNTNGYWKVIIRETAAVSRTLWNKTVYRSPEDSTRTRKKKRLLTITLLRGC
jgi:hypothetical protein